MSIHSNVLTPYHPSTPDPHTRPPPCLDPHIQTGGKRQQWALCKPVTCIQCNVIKHYSSQLPSHKNLFIRILHVQMIHLATCCTPLLSLSHSHSKVLDDCQDFIQYLHHLLLHTLLFILSPTPGNIIFYNMRNIPSP